jgi:hypothetical protein
MRATENQTGAAVDSGGEQDSESMGLLAIEEAVAQSMFDSVCRGPYIALGGLTSKGNRMSSAIVGVANLVQTETGPRHALQGSYHETRIEVVAGYDIKSDEWLFHVYLHNNQGRTDRLTEMPTRSTARSLHAAFQSGMETAARHLDQQGQQRQQEHPDSHGA